MKNSKQKILLLRKHETTGKYFVYKDKQFRWINSDKSTFYCNLTEPPIPMNILSKFTPGPNLRKLYKKYFTSCEVSFPKVAQDEKQFRKEKRCKICEYILDTLDYKQCEYCEHCYHTQCLDPIACKPGFRNLWRCPDCPRCENCLGIYDKLLKCIECNNYFHEKCVDINLLPTPGKIWKCELCAQCIHCKIRPTEASVKWNETINKCNSCDMKWKKNEYCCICEKFWFSKKGRQSRTEQRLSQNDDPEMIECDKCKMWVHLACETSMTPDMWSQFTADKNMKYYCPRCYKEKENNEMLQIVNQLIDLEKNEYFIKKIEEPYYYKVIKNPMFFETMIENAKDGVYFKNSQLLKDHFTLLCENAMHFLKANTEGFKAAKKLLEDGFNLLDTKFLPTKRKKISVPTPQKKHKLEQDLENFSLDLPTSLDVPEFYDFSMDLVLSLPVVTFYPSLTIIINKSDIQPYMGPKPLLSFYPLPSPISYSDPSLSFEELCYICSSFIRPEEVLICNICSRAFHDFCISSGPISSVSNWRCKDCRVCEICNSTQDALNILYCKKCEKGYDVQCLWPNVKGGLYLKDWVCDKCFNCQRCNTCFYHVPGYSPNREDFFSDFSLCFKCKWVVVNKDYCPECSKDWSSPYEESSSQEKILCKSCEFYFHLDCVHDWKGVCGKCYTNSLEYSQIEQGTLEKVQTFLNITAQTSVYQILAKHCIQHRYKIDPELSTLLANFFLTDNFEFMTSNSDIKNFFASRGVEIVKKTTARNSRYGNSRIGKTEGLRVSDIPSVRIPAVKIHRVEHLMNIWSVEWDTSFLIRCLKKILTPLDNIEIVEVFLLPKPSQNANVSVAPVFLWDFDEINSYMDIPKDPDSELYQRCEWTITSNKEISPIVDETLYEEKSDGLRPGDISQDVFINEYTHEQVISSYVKQELPAAVSFINKFEIWLKDHLIDVTQHLLNNNKSLQLAEQKPVKLIKIEKINEKIENDPVFNLQCCLCKDTGEKTISGRLLPCEDSCWVHVNCAYWSFEVKLDEHGNLFNLHLAISRGKKTVTFI
jgi:Bromodomain